MAGSHSLESFQALYTDLAAITESNVSDALLFRVGVQLDEMLGDFQGLLDKKARNDASRQSLATGLHIHYKRSRA
jgi:nuclear pore complex protein Nup205